MHPVIHKWMIMRTLTLGNFIFVMRKLQILTAAMNIKMYTQKLLTHC